MRLFLVYLRFLSWYFALWHLKVWQRHLENYQTYSFVKHYEKMFFRLYSFFFFFLLELKKQTFILYRSSKACNTVLMCVFVYIQSLCVLNCWSLLIIIPMNKPLMASFSALRWLWTGLDSAMLQLLPLEGLWGTREKVKAHTGLNSKCIAWFADLRRWFGK